MRLHAYLQRIRLDAEPPSPDALRRMHAAHREAFLFENLSIQSGAAISVVLEDIERKFIDEGKGGYCFEHNTLFAAALRDAGYAAAPLLGRVRRGPPERWARTHMVLRVQVPGAAGDWLADVGFGAIGLIEPIPFSDGATATQRGVAYSLRREDRLWVLSMRDATQSMDLYEFTDDPQTAGDIVVANHYTSTHPESMFRRTLTIQRVRDNDRFILRNEILSHWDDGRLSEQAIDRARLREVARDLFGVELPKRPMLFEAEPERRSTETTG